MDSPRAFSDRHDKALRLERLYRCRPRLRWRTARQ
jgi:hypothetical protein